MTHRRLVRALTIAVLPVVAAGCTTNEPTTSASAPVSTTSSATPTPTLDGPLDPEHAFQVALAMVPRTDVEWNGPSTSELTRITVCGVENSLAGVDAGVVIEDQHVEHDDDEPVARPLESLQAAAVAIPAGKEAASATTVGELTTCLADDEDVTKVVELPTASTGSVAVRVDEAFTQSNETKVFQSSTWHVHAGAVLVCIADGADATRVAETATACGQRGVEAVDVIRTGLPTTGTTASAAVVAGRLRATAGGTPAARQFPDGAPCYGTTKQPPPLGQVNVTLVLKDSGIAPASVTVQPVASTDAARQEVEAYRALVPGCATGEHLLRKASAYGKESRVTRTAATTTDTSGGGVRFSSFFGTAKKRTGTYQHTEVFAVGPHVVFVTGEDPDAAARAAANVDAAIRDVLTSEIDR